nr:TauD/TfdA family dioxygenase [Phytohabitans aurantiacus]
MAAIRAALVERKVLFFRDQDLDPDTQIGLGRRLGELTASHPVVGGVDDDHPEICALDSADNGFADVWHTDVTFMPRPPLGSILRAVVLPPSGGDTTWADSQIAYESLAEPVQRLVDQLSAVHDGNREFGYYLAQRRGGKGSVWDGEVVTRLDPVEHPVARVHPETGRKGIFVNSGFTSHIVGVSEAESRGILDLLYAHLTKPEHLVRHRWRPGDVATWDNRSTAHYANRDYGTAHRVMHRITLRGDRPYGPAAQR